MDKLSDEEWPINKERARQGLPPITQCVAAPVPPLAEVAHLLTVMFGSATARVDEGGDVLGYVVKTGALHRLVGLLQEHGHSVTIPARMPEEQIKS